MIPFVANAYEGLHGPHAAEGLIKNAATGGVTANGETIRFWPKAGRTTKQASRQQVRVKDNLMFVRSIHPPCNVGRRATDTSRSRPDRRLLSGTPPIPD